MTLCIHTKTMIINIIIIIAKTRKTVQFKLTNIQGRKRVSDKTGEILIERNEIAMKEIKNKFDKIIKTTNEIV